MEDKKGRGAVLRKRGSLPVLLVPLTTNVNSLLIVSDKDPILTKSVRNTSVLGENRLCVGH